MFRDPRRVSGENHGIHVAHWDTLIGVPSGRAELDGVRRGAADISLEDSPVVQFDARPLHIDLRGRHSIPGAKPQKLQGEITTLVLQGDPRTADGDALLPPGNHQRSTGKRSVAKHQVAVGARAPIHGDFRLLPLRKQFPARRIYGALPGIHIPAHPERDVALIVGGFPDQFKLPVPLEHPVIIPRFNAQTLFRIPFQLEQEIRAIR